MCADLTTPSFLAVSGGLAGGVQGKRDLRGCFYHLPWQLLGWKDCCCGWLLLDLLAISVATAVWDCTRTCPILLAHSVLLGITVKAQPPLPVCSARQARTQMLASPQCA